MKSILPLLLSLAGTLLSVNSQNIPYISFMGSNLSNHSYVDLTLVGDDTDGNNSVQCHSNVGNCCGTEESFGSGFEGGFGSGDWYFPNGNKTGLIDEPGGIYEQHASHRVDLRRRNNSTISGIYHCTMETFSVELSWMRVYVGLFAVGGDVTVPGGVIFSLSSDQHGESPQFTLTCNSFSGPATTTTWTRDGQEVSGGRTVLDDPELAQYTHTLTVNGRLGGVYECTVSNNKPSAASANYTVKIGSAPTDLTAVQLGPTSILLSWNPPMPLGDTTGYRITYDSEDNSNSKYISQNDQSNYLLTGLQNGQEYNIHIAGLSQNLASHSTAFPDHVQLTPDALSATVNGTTATTISLYWSVSIESVVDHYVVEWERDMSGDCENEDEGSITIHSGSSYTITGLEEDSRYTITVEATNGAGNVIEYITARTLTTVPSAPPNSVCVLSITSTSVTIQWDQVDCIHRNGDITGFSVQYRVHGDSSLETVNVTGSTSTETVIGGLDPSTMYDIQVAAVNWNGTGLYSSPRRALTLLLAPLVTTFSATSRTIALSWNNSGRHIDSNEVVWERDTSGVCSDEDKGSTTITDGSTTYTIQSLQEDSSYRVIVKAANAAGSVASDAAITNTLTASPSAPPTSLSTHQVTQATITLHWGLIDCIYQNGDITGYSVLYTTEGYTHTVTVSGSTTTEATISGLTALTNYTFQVAGTNSAGIGVYSGLLEVGTSPVLLEAPNSFQASADERKVTFSWSSPNSSMLILGYALSCFPSPATLPQSFAQSGTHVIGGFSPHTTYNCSVAAYNSHTTGPPSHVIATTKEDYVLFQIHINLQMNCTEWESEGIYLKVGTISSAVQEELIASCHCEVNNTIDEEILLCFSNSTNYVTYRARMSGTFHNDSLSLISLIEDWVSTGPSILILGVLFEVDTNCSVIISDFSENECPGSLDETGKSRDFPILGVTVGVGVPFVTFVVFLFIFILCCLRRRCTTDEEDFSIELAIRTERLFDYPDVHSSSLRMTLPPRVSDIKPL